MANQTDSERQMDNLKPEREASFAASDGSENGPVCPECGCRFALTEHDHLDNVSWSSVLCCGKSFRVEKRTTVRWLISPNSAIGDIPANPDSANR